MKHTDYAAMLRNPEYREFLLESMSACKTQSVPQAATLTVALLNRIQALQEENERLEGDDKRVRVILGVNQEHIDDPDACGQAHCGCDMISSVVAAEIAAHKLEPEMGITPLHSSPLLKLRQENERLREACLEVNHRDELLYVRIALSKVEARMVNMATEDWIVAEIKAALDHSSPLDALDSGVKATDTQEGPGSPREG